ncbi:hypothetical protein C1H46_000779 [Malus baccata]|uniref:Uncharacterized protein n=1 Tax=Malus baccata TaxID=106549 RepID=A0A540NRW2_MALBA|nr:hypothetical protein C1H46_000779 [Malus baccata]
MEIGNASVPSPVGGQIELERPGFLFLGFHRLHGVSLNYCTLSLCNGEAAISLSKLADTAREELPSTLAAVRLSAMEISDLTLN